MLAERVMDLVDQSQRKLLVPLFPRRARQLEEVAHCKGVGPQVTLLRAL